MNSLYHYLSQVPDHRRIQGLRTPIGGFIEMILLAGMSGRFAKQAISRFMKENEDFFVERYGLNHGVPGYTCMRTFMEEVDNKALCKALSDWINQFLEEKDWIAIDGKAIGSTVTHGQDHSQNYKSMVSSFCKSKGIVVDTISIENKKENEGQAARDLIERFEKKGMIFTMDALHCQKKLRKPSWSQEMAMSFS